MIVYPIRRPQETPASPLWQNRHCRRYNHLQPSVKEPKVSNGATKPIRLSNHARGLDVFLLKEQARHANPL